VPWAPTALTTTNSTVTAPSTAVARRRATVRRCRRTSIDSDGGPGGAGYAFAKIAAAHYVNDFALALAKFSIRMNAVHPTNVNTDMLHSATMYRAFRPDLKEPTREDAEPVFPVVQAMPVPYVEPEDISEAVLFLASDAARYITGQQLRVDAGGFLKVKPWSGG